MTAAKRVLASAVLASSAFSLGLFGAAAETGVTDTEIVFGQSAAYSGPAGELGKGMRLGLLAAFGEANRAGGVNGRQIKLIQLDDGYEPDRSVENTRLLIEKEEVFALIGAVGTPTSRSATPIAEEAGVPYVAPFTGAGFLRDHETLSTVINFRASYQQEVNEIIDRLIEDRGITRIGVLYQNDSFGRTVHSSTIKALENRGLELVTDGVYPRNTTAVKTAVFDLQLRDPDAVIFVGAYEPVATAVKWASKIGFNPVFVTISFVGSNALARELGPVNSGVFVTQVVPHFESTDLEAADRYRKALDEFQPGAPRGFVSFEGYMAGRMAIAALEACESEVSRECFMSRLRSQEPIELGGMTLHFESDDNQGSDEVFVTAINSRGEFVPIRTLNDDFSK